MKTLTRLILTLAFFISPAFFVIAPALVICLVLDLVAPAIEAIGYEMGRRSA